MPMLYQRSRPRHWGHKLVWALVRLFILQTRTQRDVCLKDCHYDEVADSLLPVTLTFISHSVFFFDHDTLSREYQNFSDIYIYATSLREQCGAATAMWRMRTQQQLFPSPTPQMRI
jgi:hypothetical protein